MSVQDKTCEIVVTEAYGVYVWTLALSDGQVIDTANIYADSSEATEAARSAARRRGLTIIEEEPE